MKTLKILAVVALIILNACKTATEQKETKEVKFAVDETFTGHVFPELPYAYNALEPYIDAQTMEIHYDRHHRGYYRNFLNAIEGTELEKVRLEDIFEHISTLSPAIRNNGGGLYNHNLFWTILDGSGTTSPSNTLSQAIERDFGSFESFREQFSTAAKSQFGSGWAWLSVNSDKKLFVSSTPNQDNPLMDVAALRGTPILGIDVWEHAYYLKYQNKRADYVENFWKIIKWDVVNQLYEEAVK